jgi:formylglycine-generating enzyme required for sulfatase activity
VLPRRTFIRHLSCASGALLVSRHAAGQATQLAFAGTQPGQERTIEGIRLRWCPPGTFLMGSPASEPGRRADEEQVAVTLSRGYWTATYEVTQRQWSDVMGAWPYRAPNAQFGIGDDVPAYWVNFMDAERFCEALTTRARRAGELPPNCEFRLPTEAQWEYACRAGTTSATPYGPRLTREHGNLADDSPEQALRKSPRLALAVGSYPPNPWGICDMLGNIFEWCRDWYHARLPGGVDPDIYTEKGVQNRDGTYSRVRRGGAWNDGPEFCRSALRLRYEPERSSDHIGFRVMLVHLS